jgi:hypothetical protein
MRCFLEVQLLLVIVFKRDDGAFRLVIHMFELRYTRPCAAVCRFHFPAFRDTTGPG